MHLAQNWRLRNTRYSLKTVHCAHCGTLIIPSHRLCNQCQPEAAEHYRLNSGDAPIISFPGNDFSRDDIRQAAR